MIRTFTKTQVLEFLRNNPVMNIAVAHETKPIASVVLFSVDDDFTFYFVTHVNSYKTKALKNNNKISFTVWKHFEMLVQIDGKAEAASEETTNLIIGQLAVSSSKVEDFWPPILSLVNNDYIAFKIKPSWLRVLDLKKLNIAETENPFQLIEIN